MSIIHTVLISDRSLKWKANHFYHYTRCILCEDRPHCPGGEGQLIPKGAKSFCLGIPSPRIHLILLTICIKLAIIVWFKSIRFPADQAAHRVRLGGSRSCCRWDNRCGSVNLLTLWRMSLAPRSKHLSIPCVKIWIAKIEFHPSKVLGWEKEGGVWKVVGQRYYASW